MLLESKLNHGEKEESGEDHVIELSGQSNAAPDHEKSPRDQALQNVAEEVGCHKTTERSGAGASRNSAGSETPAALRKRLWKRLRASLRRSGYKIVKERRGFFHPGVAWFVRVAPRMKMIKPRQRSKYFLGEALDKRKAFRRPERKEKSRSS